MTVVSDITKASVLTLSTIILVGILLVLYYSLGLPMFIIFLFILYLFVIHGVKIKLEFKKFDPIKQD